MAIKNKNAAQYPTEFVGWVKAEFPDAYFLHQSLDSGSEFVGEFLKDASVSSMDPRKVASMIDQDRVQELRDEAQKAVRRQSLYQEWRKIAATMFQSSV